MSRVLGTLIYDIKSSGYSNMSFKFKYVEMDNGDINIYILDQPAYRAGQDTDGHTTHRYGIGSSEGPYICYEPMPRNSSDAKIISEEWAMRTAYYIKFGKWYNKGDM
jgi:hypothetical protein